MQAPCRFPKGAKHWVEDLHCRFWRPKPYNDRPKWCRWRGVRAADHSSPTTPRGILNTATRISPWFSTPSLAPLPPSSVYNYVVNNLGSRLSWFCHGGSACASPHSPQRQHQVAHVLQDGPTSNCAVVDGHGRCLVGARDPVSDHQGRVVPAPRRSERFASPVPRCCTTALPVSSGLDVTKRRRRQLNNTPQGSWV